MSQFLLHRMGKIGKVTFIMGMLLLKNLFLSVCMSDSFDLKISICVYNIHDMFYYKMVFINY